MAKFLDSVGLSHLIAWMKTSLPYLKSTDLSDYAKSADFLAKTNDVKTVGTAASKAFANTVTSNGTNLPTQSAVASFVGAYSIKASQLPTISTGDVSGFTTDVGSLISTAIAGISASGTGNAASTITSWKQENGVFTPTFGAITIASAKVTGLGTAAGRTAVDEFSSSANTLPTCSAIAGYISTYSINASQLPTISTGDVSGFTTSVNSLISASIAAISASGTGNAASTITSWKQENGVFTPTFGAIAIASTQVSGLGGAAAKGVVTSLDSTANLPTAGAVKTYIDNAISGVTQFKYEVVTTLPTANAAAMGKIYLIAHTHSPADNNVASGAANGYDEYICLESGTSTKTYKWEKIGSTDINLSGYLTKPSSSPIGSDIKGIYWTGSAFSAMTHSLEADVPSNAVFTDTTYNAATQSTAGLMSADDKKKLDGIANQANKYELPTAGKDTLGGVKTTSTVTATTGLTASPIISGVVYYKDTTYGAATDTASGLMTADQKKKLDAIAEGANNYELPTAGKDTLGGVKTTSTVTSTSGLTAAPIINGVVYYKDTNTNTTYTFAGNDDFSFTVTPSNGTAQTVSFGTALSNADIDAIIAGTYAGD